MQAEAGCMDCPGSCLTDVLVVEQRGFGYPLGRNGDEQRGWEGQEHM